MDNRVSSVMAAFRHSENPGYRETLGFVFTHRHHYSDEQLEGARAASKKLGYILDVIRPWESGMTGRNVSRVLQARGIRGVLLSPNAHVSHPHYRLEWSRFATVLLGSSLANHHLCRVKMNHFLMTQTACRKLLHLGYERIGLLVDRSLDERTNREISSSFRAWGGCHGTPSKAPIFFTEPDSTPAHLAKWIGRNKPDAILADTAFRLEQWVGPAGYHCPRDLGFASISINGTKGVAGICQDLKEVGGQGVQLLDSLLKLRHFGLRTDPLTLLVGGEWQNGSSL